MSNLPSLKQLLKWGIEQLAVAAIPMARLDAEYLLAELLGWSRAQLLARDDRLADEETREAFERLIQRRKKREPVAYLLERKGFYGRDFFVDHRVLIPRPETEEVVERALTVMAEQTKPRIADIGTGSGVIAITLAAEHPTAQVVAVDISAEALAVARENAARHHVSERIAFYAGSLLEPIQHLPPFDLIVANLPYVGTNEMTLLAEDVKYYEPHQALFAGPRGLDLFDPFFEQVQAFERLRPNGTILLEIGYAQGNAIAQLARTYFPHARSITVHQDLARHERIVELCL